MVRNRDPAERTVLRIMKEILVCCRNIHTSQVRAAVTVCLMQLSFLEDHTPENKTMSPKAEMRSIQIHWQNRETNKTVKKSIHTPNPVCVCVCGCFLLRLYSHVLWSSQVFMAKELWHYLIEWNEGHNNKMQITHCINE